MPVCSSDVWQRRIITVGLLRQNQRTVFMVDDQKRKLFRTELRPRRTTNDDNDTQFDPPPHFPLYVPSTRILASHNHSFLVLASTTNGLKSCNGRGGTSLSPRFAVNSVTVVLTHNDPGLHPHLFNPRSRKWYRFSFSSLLSSPCPNLSPNQKLQTNMLISTALFRDRRCPAGIPQAPFGCPTHLWPAPCPAYDGGPSALPLRPEE
jgi:hypothetical protein